LIDRLKNSWKIRSGQLASAALAHTITMIQGGVDDDYSIPK
jgi:hypothetical protein